MHKICTWLMEISVSRKWGSLRRSHTEGGSPASRRATRSRSTKIHSRGSKSWSTIPTTPSSKIPSHIWWRKLFFHKWFAKLVECIQRPVKKWVVLDIRRHIWINNTTPSSGWKPPSSKHRTSWCSCSKTASVWSPERHICTENIKLSLTQTMIL